MPRGRPKLSKEALLARGTFEQRKQGDRLETKELEVIRPKLPKRPTTHYQPEIPFDFDDLIEANYDKPVAECVAAVPRDLSKKYAQKWAWDASDELAIRNGCRFDLKRAMHFAYTLRNHLVLWEGRWSGEPFILRTWQPECLLRVFGWVRPHHELEWIRRISKSSTWVTKKSGKSPTGAAVAIYCWRFDGVWKHKDDNEPNIGGGQHVFCIAKNGKQAGIVWGHSKNMTHNSPLLRNEVTLGTIRTNLAQSIMTYEPKLSKLTTVTGDNQANRAAGEGLNAACIVCDEAHVVDKRMVEIVTDAGASQEQFLWFQISTYGDSDGYGKEDLDRGRDVADGKLEDDAFLFKTYEAPQDATDEDCGREEVWYQANPNLGYTVSARQFEQSYLRAKDDPASFAGFKQRRLNIWQRASNPMFNFIQWQGCSDETISNLRGVGGGAGIDLAATEDWAALALAWDEGDLLKSWVKLWATEEWILENDHRASFQKWSNAGHLTMVPGASIDFEMVQTETIQILKLARTGCLGFDYMFGAQMAQNINRKVGRLTVYKFTQSVESYAQATAELKNNVKNGTLRHPGNPALDWQAGHVRSKQSGEYERPIKDPDAPWKKVDGIQALCMAIRCRLEAPEQIKPYVGIV